MTTRTPARYIHNYKLFTPSYFERVLADPSTATHWSPPDDVDARIEQLRAMWGANRRVFLRDSRASGEVDVLQRVGLPDGYVPVAGPSESAIENEFIRPTCANVLGYAVAQNRTLKMRTESEASQSLRPDLILFPSPESHARAVEAAESATGVVADGVAYCRNAAFIVDAKRFSKGIGADETLTQLPKAKRTGMDRTALQDVLQVATYLDGYEVRWGALTNGRSWRLMLAGAGTRRHLRFDLVLWLEELGDASITDDDRVVFSLFLHLFGLLGTQGGYLDALERDSHATSRSVRTVLRENAHAAVELIANGFWRTVDNRRSGLTVAPTLPPQRELDRLREVSLTLLYRLLFIMKSEELGLLRMREESGARTPYAKHRSIQHLYERLKTLGPDELQYANVFRDLSQLFEDVDRGSDTYGIPAYNGGLFDPERHVELKNWRMEDGALLAVLTRLVYEDHVEGDERVIPYRDLDVRDLGDVYEGLLEQRLTGVASDPPTLQLRNEKGERKASGSYFTKDAFVDHLVRKVLTPQLDALGDDVAGVLQLRVLDPAMGSGHFLVKAVDVIADHLTLQCDPIESSAPRDNGPAEFAYWKRVVVENCIYGVDYNPMAVELARVALWLHTAEFGRPLSFVDHHLKAGNSLIGATVSRLAKPGLGVKERRGSPQWYALAPPAPAAVNTATKASLKKAKHERRAERKKQLLLPFAIETDVLSGILRSIKAVLAQPSETADDVKRKSQEYARLINDKLRAHRMLADLWCHQWFAGDPTTELVEAYLGAGGLYDQLKEACGILVDDERNARLDALCEHPVMKAMMAAGGHGHGPRVEEFFHWELEFPEVAFDAEGKRKSGLGFDAVVGNPPWDRIRAERKQFYGPFSDPDRGEHWDVANAQSASLDDLIRRLHSEHPGLENDWLKHEAQTSAVNEFLRSAGDYEHQVVVLDGRKTGGDPDLFRYFVERSVGAVREGGRVGLVVPSTLWQAQGCTGLRRLLLRELSTEELFVFENYRKWAFSIDSRFKFTTFVSQKHSPPAGHKIRSGFMLRNMRAVHGLDEHRVVTLGASAVETLSPGSLALLDLRTSKEAALIERLHDEFVPLGDANSEWRITYTRELDMTSDAWRFKTASWMRKHGFAEVMRRRDEGGEWEQIVSSSSPSAKYPSKLPAGGCFWVAADSDWYEARGYLREDQEVNGQTRTVYIDPIDEKKPQERGVASATRHRIIPNSLYRVLFNGRLVRDFDHAQKRWASGSGARAKWVSLPFQEKVLHGQFYVSEEEVGSTLDRVGVCDVARGTDERTVLAALLPGGHAAGNTVPTLGTDSDFRPRLLALLNSFVVDSLARLRVNSHVNWMQLSSIPLPQPSGLDPASVDSAVAALSCTTPELGDFWERFAGRPWSPTKAALSLAQRASIRAELDAQVAKAFKLTVEEYALLLTGFPLLDRSQDFVLPGDRFVTEMTRRRPAATRGVDWEETEDGPVEYKPRSFITRDLALLTYMRLCDYRPPRDLNSFYRDEVGFDPDGSASRFRIGAERDLIDRVKLATDAGAVAYVPGN